jgi:hypothetical protein
VALWNESFGVSGYKVILAASVRRTHMLCLSTNIRHCVCNSQFLPVVGILLTRASVWDMCGVRLSFPKIRLNSTHPYESYLEMMVWFGTQSVHRIVLYFQFSVLTIMLNWCTTSSIVHGRVSKILMGLFQFPVHGYSVKI